MVLACHKSEHLNCQPYKSLHLSKDSLPPSETKFGGHGTTPNHSLLCQCRSSKLQQICFLRMCSSSKRRAWNIQTTTWTFCDIPPFSMRNEFSGSIRFGGSVWDIHAYLSRPPIGGFLERIDTCGASPISPIPSREHPKQVPVACVLLCWFIMWDDQLTDRCRYLQYEGQNVTNRQIPTTTK